MKIGDLVKADPWVNEGAIGIVLSVQDRDDLSSAYVLIGDVVMADEGYMEVMNEKR